MGDIISFAYQYADSFALLALSSIGLVIIFGMMGVINMAHGEFMMIGAFGASFGFQWGLPLSLAIVTGVFAATAIGLLLERLVIRKLYGRLLYSLVATWGISLVLSQGALVLIGPSVPSLPNPFGTVSVGGMNFSVYRLFLVALAIALIVTLWALMRFTNFGLHARATMTEPDMAEALGVRTTRIYMVTFGLGAALAGFAGAIFGLSAQIQPTFGAAYTPIAFIVVVVAGSRNIIAGLLASALVLALVKTSFTVGFNILTGYVAMLVTALIIIRLSPTGILDLIGKLKALASRHRSSTKGTSAEETKNA